MEQKIDELVKSYREDMIQSLEELVSIPSVINLENAGEGAPFGMEIRSALDGLLKLAGELGFETRDYDGYAAAVDFGTEGKEVGILSHIDVVPPGNGWSKNPFVPEIVNGKMYGRGTIDDKGPLVASLYAMKAVKESGLPIRNHVRHIIGCDEETGHRCIKYYLTKEKGPDLGFSPDGMFSVIHAEKGILRFQIQTNRKLPDTKELCVIRIAGGTVVNAVPNIAEVWLGGPGEQLEEVRKEFQVKAAEGSAKMEGDVLHLTFSLGSQRPCHAALAGGERHPVHDPFPEGSAFWRPEDPGIFSEPGYPFWRRLGRPEPGSGLSGSVVRETVHESGDPECGGREDGT